jgi:hypothetical protein
VAVGEVKSAGEGFYQLLAGMLAWKVECGYWPVGFIAEKSNLPPVEAQEHLNRAKVTQIRLMDMLAIVESLTIAACQLQTGSLLTAELESLHLENDDHRRLEAMEKAVSRPVTAMERLSSEEFPELKHRPPVGLGHPHLLYLAIPLRLCVVHMYGYV